jgi:glutamine synthetase
MIRGVDLHADLLRAAIASAGNDHRLGANEAPPAIISIFLGGMLSDILEQVETGSPKRTLRGGTLHLGARTLPQLPRHSGDRNRTSPFAFTGNKFEFRAVGSSQSIAFPVMLLNAVVADAIGEITEQLREELRQTPKVDDAVLKVVRRAFQETAAIRFEGNGYSQDWVEEAERRGLPNCRRAPQALEQLVTEQSRALFTSLGILTEVELQSRFHVRVERYVKDLLIELHTMLQLVDTLVLPSAYSYLGMLAEGAAKARQAGITAIPQIAAANEVGELTERLRERRDAMAAVVGKADAMHESAEACAALLTGEAADRMAEVRELCDRLELVVGDDHWPLPKYREMLFPV